MSANHVSGTTGSDSVPPSRKADATDQLNAEMVREAASYVRTLLPRDFAPVVAVVCGSGLASIADSLSDVVRIAFADIPHFPTSTVVGHAGTACCLYVRAPSNLTRCVPVFVLLPSEQASYSTCALRAGNLLLGRFGGKPLVLLQGRAHPYEGNRHWESALYVWVLRELGVRVLVLTNAAGGLNQAYRVGQLVLVKDQLDLPTFAGANALYGLRDARLYEHRFVSMRGAYDLELRRLVLTCARDLWGESALTLEGGPEGPGIVQVRGRTAWLHSHATTKTYKLDSSDSTNFNIHFHFKILINICISEKVF